MQLTFDLYGNICIVSLKGRFTTGSESEYRLVSQEIQELGARNTIVNCADLPWLDSTGLSFVVALHNMLKDRNGEIALTFVNARVRKSLELTRLLEVIPVFDNMESALAAFNAG
jgi:anti-anti-sigma factor